MCSLRAMGRACALPCGGYLPLHQEPSASLCGQYQPLPLVLGFMPPCLGHCGVSSAVCPLWAWSHWLASSTCALTLAKSTPRKVTRTSCPCRVAFRVIDTGASGRGVVGASGCAGVGWLAGLAVSSVALVSSCARRAMAAPRRLQSMQGSPLTPLLQNRACEFPRTRLLSY